MLKSPVHYLLCTLGHARFLLFGFGLVSCVKKAPLMPLTGILGGFKAAMCTSTFVLCLLHRAFTSPH